MRRAPEHRLTTERLELLPVTALDLPALQALYADPDVRRRVFDDVQVDDLETDNTIRQSLRTFRANSYGLWRVSARGDTTLAGCCGLREVGLEAELIVAIEPARRRRGCAREAALAVLTHALRQLRLPRVVAMCDVDDDAGRALCRSLGMREQHVTRASGLHRTMDVLMYDVTFADLPTQTAPVVRKEA